MATRVITYTPKVTGARTEYRTVSIEDYEFLMDYMMRGLVKMACLSNATDEGLKELRDHVWRKRRKTLPRGRHGQNSPESMIAGIVDNMLFTENGQRDFTAPQMEALEYISPLFEAIDPEHMPSLRFQIGLFHAE